MSFKNVRLRMHTVAVRDDGCFSVLLWDGRPFAVSVERTFAPGEAAHKKHTVISRGVYACRRGFYHRGGYETFEIVVPMHTEVKFHKGNTEFDSLGCPLVAESFGMLNGMTAVLDAKGGFNELMRLAAGLEKFDMEVINR